jgi:hypothetical protein
MNASSTCALTLAVAWALTACSGGGTDPGTNTDTGGVTPPTAGKSTATGVWQGTISSNSGTPAVRMMALTAPNGHSVWMTTDGRVWNGQLPMTGAQFDATMSGYMYPGSHFADGSNFGPATMRMDHTGSGWSGTYDGNGDAGSFSVAMSAMWERPASLDSVAGVYTRTTSIGYTMTLTITQSGELAATDSRGCVISGSVSVPDASRNLYELDATVTSCGVFDGTYHGMGTLLDADAMRDWSESMGCFQYGSGGMMGGGGMMGSGWWPMAGSNTVPSGTRNLLMFAIVNGHHALMDALAR